ncbi:MAG: PfkB family carbohydrate kinase [Trueperaceae bacterium]
MSADPGNGWGAGRPAVAFVGLSCRDHAWRVERFPPTASRTPALGYRAAGGGPAATAAVAAARLGADARLWAIHGDDEDGRANAAELASFGVALGGVRAPAGARSFVSAVLVDPEGERSIFPYRGAGLEDDPTHHDWRGLEGCGAVLVDARHPVLAAHALAWAEARGVPRVGDWGDDRHPELRARIDHLVAAEEAGALALAARGTAAPNDPLEAAALGTSALRDAPTQLVAITLGARGCVWDDGQRVWHQVAPRVAVVDTNGAGDAFHGAFAAAIAAGWDAAASFRLATAVAALKCTGEGRAALPDLATARAVADALPTATDLGPSTGGPA